MQSLSRIEVIMAQELGDHTGLLGNVNHFGPYAKSNRKLHVEGYMCVMTSFAGGQVKCLVLRWLKKVWRLQYFILLAEPKGSCHGCDDSIGQLRKIRDKLAFRHGKPKKEPHTPKYDTSPLWHLTLPWEWVAPNLMEKTSPVEMSSLGL